MECGAKNNSNKYFIEELEDSKGLIRQNIDIGDKNKSYTIDFLKEKKFLCYNENEIVPSNLSKKKDYFCNKLKINYLDEDTYKINELNENIIKIIELIKEFFIYKISYSEKEIIHLVNMILKSDTNYIFKALDELVEKKIELYDSSGRIGYLINRGKYYIFQIKIINDENILYKYRKILSSPKINSIVLRESKEDTADVSSSTNSKKKPIIIKKDFLIYISDTFKTIEEYVNTNYGKDYSSKKKEEYFKPSLSELILMFKYSFIDKLKLYERNYLFFLIINEFLIKKIELKHYKFSDNLESFILKYLILNKYISNDCKFLMMNINDNIEFYSLDNWSRKLSIKDVEDFIDTNKLKIKPIKKQYINSLIIKQFDFQYEEALVNGWIKKNNFYIKNSIGFKEAVTKTGKLNKKKQIRGSHCGKSTATFKPILRHLVYALSNNFEEIIGENRQKVVNLYKIPQDYKNYKVKKTPNYKNRTLCEENEILLRYREYLTQLNISIPLYPLLINIDIIYKKDYAFIKNSINPDLEIKKWFYYNNYVIFKKI